MIKGVCKERFLVREREWRWNSTSFYFSKFCNASTQDLQGTSSKERRCCYCSLNNLIPSMCTSWIWLKLFLQVRHSREACKQDGRRRDRIGENHRPPDKSVTLQSYRAFLHTEYSIRLWSQSRFQVSHAPEKPAWNPRSADRAHTVGSLPLRRHWKE